MRPGGPPGQILAALHARRAFELILSPAIVAEVQEGIARPKVRRYLPEPDQAPVWLADLVAVALLVRDTGRTAGASRDPEDEVVLAAAVEGRAGAIVTGDGDLLALGAHEGIPILAPRAFLGLIEE